MQATNSITDKIYTIDLFNTGKPVKVMVVFSRYGQNGSLAVELFAKDEQKAKDKYIHEKDLIYSKHYAVISSNDCHFNLLERDQQFINEVRYPGLGEWLIDNGIGYEVPCDKSMTNYGMNPLFRFNHDFTPTPVDEFHVEKMMFKHEDPIAPPTFESLFGVREHRYNLMNILEKSETLEDIVRFYRLVPENMKETLKDVIQKITDKTNEYNEVKSIPPQMPEGNYPKTRFSAEVIIDTYSDASIRYPDERRTIYSGPEGYTIMVGIPIYENGMDMSSTVMLLSRSKKDEFRGKHFVKVDRFGRFEEVGPSFDVSVNGHSYFIPDPEHTYECWYTANGDLDFYKSNNEIYEVSKEYDDIVDEYRKEITKLIQPMYALVKD